jgi:ComF family protein
MNTMKFQNKRRIAEGLGILWASLVSCDVLPSGDFTLIPMPMHRTKQRERGFNQAEIFTEKLSQKLNIPMSQILIRTHDTPPQSGLHPSQRIENVKGIFSIRKNENLRGRSFIIIDDIFTTGASLNECAKTLKSAGADKIFCMTLAITLKNKNEKLK